MTLLDMMENPNLTDDQSAVYQAISTCCGKDKAISAAEITRKTGIADRRARAIVKDLVEEFGYPILSCPNGFFVPLTAEEVDAAYRQYVSWGMSLLRRASRLRQSPRVSKLLGQLTLELGIDQVKH